MPEERAQEKTAAGADQPGAGSKRKGGRQSAMTDEMRGRAVPLLEAGVRVQEIARQVGLDASTIYKYRAELLANEQRPATGFAKRLAV